MGGWLVGWLAAWLVDWFVVWLLGWLVGWLVGCWVGGLVVRSVPDFQLVSWVFGCIDDFYGCDKNLFKPIYIYILRSNVTHSSMRCEATN